MQRLLQFPDLKVDVVNLSSINRNNNFFTLCIDVYCFWD